MCKEEERLLSHEENLRQRIVLGGHFSSGIYLHSLLLGLKPSSASDVTLFRTNCEQVQFK